jgi:NADPH-dependent 2,4-dienoyl-CoA reductase/sulfur reductase-like enzyme
VVDDVNKLVARRPEEFAHKQDIDVRIGHEVLAIDSKQQRVQVQNLESGKRWWEPYDRLMIATGAVPVFPQVPGADAEGIYGADSLKTAIKIKEILDRKKTERAVIVGGGYIGLEMAEALILRGLKVSLVEQAEEVMNTLDPDMGALVSKALEETGVTLYRRESLQGFDHHDSGVQAVITDQREIPADMVILGMGVRPNTAIAKAAGIPLGKKEAVKVDDRMETGIENIWSAGDCVESFHLVSKKPFYIALGTVANKQGRVAGINIGGGKATFPGAVGTAISKICQVGVARTGLQIKEIEQLELNYAEAKIKSKTRAGYYPDAEDITVKVLAEKNSGRLLGGQIVAKGDGAKRIDVLATALHAGFSVREMIHLDLSYAPPFSPVWDPVLIAVRQAIKKI